MNNNVGLEKIAPSFSTCRCHHGKEDVSQKFANIRDGQKWCPGCKAWVSFEEFHKNKSRKDGLAIHCKICSQKYNRNSRYKRRYGITIEQYNVFLKIQDFRCAICKTSEIGQRVNYFYVDHDHKTGHVRGLLCHNCNFGLGHFDDNIETLKFAIQYLTEK